MGLITKTVKIFWRNYNRKQYEDKGYKFTGLGHLFEIKIVDLFKNSKRIVKCKCDKCNKEIKMKYIDYNKKSTEDGKIFCEDCEPYYIDNGNNKKFSGIYKIENLINGKVYVGQSNDVKQRWKNHKWAINQEDSKNKPLYRAFKKHGIDNFSFKVIIECDINDLDELEIYYIKIYNSCIYVENSDGYNQTIGGEGTRGFKRSEEWKKIMSEMHKGSNNVSAKKVICEKIEFGSLAECADYYNVNPGTMGGWLSGKCTMPKEWYDKGLRFYDKTIDIYKIRQPRTGYNNPTSIPVICEGKTFANCIECAKYYNVNPGTLNNILNGSRKMPKEWYDRGLCRVDKTMDEYEIQKDKKDYNYQTTPVYCEGKRFDSIVKCAEYYNVNSITMGNWISKRNPMPKEWYGKGLHEEGVDITEYSVSTGPLKGEDSPSSKVVYCEGIRFGSIAECKKYYNETSNMTKWINGSSPMPKSYYDKGLHLDGKTMDDYKYYEDFCVICEGKSYKTVNDFCMVYNMSKSFVWYII